MKKLLALLLSLALVLSLAACGAAPANPTPTEMPKAEGPAAPDEIPDEITAADGKYPIAMVTDVGQLKDGSFNEGIWNGVKTYAVENDIAYKYYQPANGNQATDDDRYDAMKAAADSGAQIVVCCGYTAGNAIARVAAEFTAVKWVYVDGGACVDADGNVLNNTVGISFSEEACGYFAGYSVVKDGYTKLGFVGGGGGATSSCCRFGYGWVQGANAAAQEMNVHVEMNYSWLYGATFGPSPELEAMLNGWYENGTEVVFPCGGGMYLSCFSAAAANDAWSVGVDSDQWDDSETVLTSAMKGVDTAAYWVLGEFFDGRWDALGGTAKILGVADDAVLLPTADHSWRFETFTVEEYEAMKAEVESGELVIDNRYPEMNGNVDAMAEAEFSNVTINYIK